MEHTDWMKVVEKDTSREFLVTWGRESRKSILRNHVCSVSLGLDELKFSSSEKKVLDFLHLGHPEPPHLHSPLISLPLQQCPTRSAERSI
jgi:hypothetical protein